MNDTNLLPDDPRITAFALGELDGDDRAVVEAAMRHNPALRATVDQIRVTVGHIEAALAEEVEAETAAKIVPFPTTGRAPGPDPYAEKTGGFFREMMRFPSAYYVVGGLAAACFAIMAILRPSPQAPARPAQVAVGKPQKVLIDMNVLMGTDGTRPTPVTAPGGEENVTVAAGGESPVPASSSLLQQAKDAEKTNGAPMPLGLALSDPTKKPALPEQFDAGAFKQAPQDTLTQVILPGDRVFTPSAEDKLVVDARPAPRPASSHVAPGLAANGSDVPVNESRGLPGTSLREITQGRDFDTVQPRGAEQVPARDLMYLPPFTMSAERIRARIAAAEAAAAREAAAAHSTEVKPFAPPAEPLALLPTQATRDSANTEVYGKTPDNGFISAAQNPFSNFAGTTDTASYANVRRLVQTHQRPPRDAVRIEELLNSFPYSYPAPAAKSDAPFATTIEVSEAPWEPAHRLVRIGVKGREVATADRPAANLVFLLDVSGSMNAPNRLPLVKESMRMLLAKLRPDDRVAIVTCAGQSSLALPSTPASRTREILLALDGLTTGGSTDGAMGVQLAYDIAKANQVEGGINRVILCTDGDFNLSPAGDESLAGLVEEKAKSGTALTVLGYGLSNPKDTVLEKLARRGHGTYGHVDSRREAEKLLVQQTNSTLVPIAKDVKIRVEFNPSQVSSYRLIGYENRMLKKEDFANDKVETGEMGAGSTITALYEVIPVHTVKAAHKDAEIEDRRYNFYSGVSDNGPLPGRIDPFGKEMLTVKVRYKKPDGVLSRALDFPLTDGGGKFTNASPDFKFAAAVAGFGMILRESPHKGSATMSDVIEWAEAGATEDAGGYRSEFIDLARKADPLVQPQEK